MIVKCAWCKHEMGIKPPYEDRSETHGICKPCRREYFPHVKHGETMTFITGVPGLTAVTLDRRTS
jgi:hypothetical protein